MNYENNWNKFKKYLLEVRNVNKELRHKKLIKYGNPYIVIDKMLERLLEKMGEIENNQNTKYEYGDKVIINIPNSIFCGLEGKVIEFTNKPYNMYIVEIYDESKIGVAEECLIKTKQIF